MASTAPEDLEEFQKLSDQYAPDVPGPLLGAKESTKAIEVEYSTADPIYQIKTKNLHQQYPQFRQCKRDGNCGWRAIAFGYFEYLLYMGDEDLVRKEEKRITDLKELLNEVLPSPDLFEDLIEPTFDLLKDLITWCKDPEKNAALLLERFNTTDVEGGIITHFRFLTSAHMRRNPDNFAPFLLDTTVPEYCSTQIEASQEIEEIGLQALQEVLIVPSGLGLEILYLDRSQGEQVDLQKRVEPRVAGPEGRPNTPVLRLLYRMPLAPAVSDEQRVRPPPGQCGRSR